MEYQALYDKIDFKTLHWNQPANNAATAVDIADYVCPSAPSRAGWYAADYFACVDIIAFPIPPNLPLGYCDLEKNKLVTQQRKLEALEGLISDVAVPIRKASDGLSKTFMFFECAGRPNEFLRGQDKGIPGGGQGGNMHWRWADKAAYGTWSPDDECGMSSVMNCTNWDDVYSFHPGGANFLMGDGSVSYFTESMDPETFVTLFTRAANDISSATP
jgi:prepilin-type processing-associated H-X9-DG protein